MQQSYFFLAALLAGPVLATDPNLNGLTDRMRAQEKHYRALALDAPGPARVPSTSSYLGRSVSDPARLPFYRSRRHVQFSDGFIAHTIHDAVDRKGQRRLVVVAHGIVRGDTDREWRIAKDEPVSPPPGTRFVGSNAEAMGCLLNGNPALVFGYLKPAAGGFQSDGDKTIAFALDPYSNPIPLTNDKIECKRAG